MSRKAVFMSFVVLRPQAPLLKRGVFATGLSLIASQGLAQRAANSPFFGLSGYWSGGGTIAMTNGATERIRCKETYAVNSTGRALNQSLRCASDSYRLEISSNVIFESGAISGTWSEATRNVSGTVSGRATSAEIQASVAGGGFFGKPRRADTRRSADRRDHATWRHRCRLRVDYLAQRMNLGPLGPGRESRRRNATASIGIKLIFRMEARMNKGNRPTRCPRIFRFESQFPLEGKLCTQSPL